MNAGLSCRNCGTTHDQDAALTKFSYNGPHRKPVYQVTRKEDEPRWHWQHTGIQIFPVLLVPSVLAQLPGNTPG